MSPHPIPESELRSSKFMRKSKFRKKALANAHADKGASSSQAQNNTPRQDHTQGSSAKETPQTSDPEKDSDTDQRDRKLEAMNSSSNDTIKTDTDESSPLNDTDQQPESDAEFGTSIIVPPFSHIEKASSPDSISSTPNSSPRLKPSTIFSSIQPLDDQAEETKPNVQKAEDKRITTPESDKHYCNPYQCWTPGKEVLHGPDNLGFFDHVLPADADSSLFAVSPEELDVAKDLILDLLGWGVEPEYIVGCGVSGELVTRVFRDLNLILPGNLPRGLDDGSFQGTAPDTDVKLEPRPTVWMV